MRGIFSLPVDEFGGQLWMDFAHCKDDKFLLSLKKDSARPPNKEGAGKFWISKLNAPREENIQIFSAGPNLIDL